MNRGFPNNYMVMTVVTLDLVLRYAFFAGVAWLLAYVIFKRRWFPRKIIPHFPASSEIRREFCYSILSMVIFGLVGTATIDMALHGWTRLYWRISDYGWTWFWGSIVCVIFLHDAYFYWTHRLMHHRSTRMNLCGQLCWISGPSTDDKLLSPFCHFRIEFTQAV
jgi:Delta7-sterol 5-desaturase